MCPHPHARGHCSPSQSPLLHRAGYPPDAAMLNPLTSRATAQPLESRPTTSSIPPCHLPHRRAHGASVRHFMRKAQCQARKAHCNCKTSHVYSCEGVMWGKGESTLGGGAVVARQRARDSLRKAGAGGASGLAGRARGGTVVLTRSRCARARGVHTSLGLGVPLLLPPLPLPSSPPPLRQSLRRWLGQAGAAAAWRPLRRRQTSCRQ
jgi:hypothetical protein